MEIISVMLVPLIFLLSTDYCFCQKSNPDTAYINLETNLSKTLFSGYQRSVRPARNASIAVSIGIAMGLIRLIELDGDTQTLTIQAIITLHWEDPRLRWNSSDYDGLNTLRVPTYRIWRPDIMLFNTAEERSSYSSIRSTYGQDALIYETGTISWMPFVRIRSHCPHYLRKFPFDTQTCILKFGSWSYSNKELNLTTLSGRESNMIDLSDYVKNKEWTLLNAVGNISVKTYGCCPGEAYPSFDSYFSFMRESSFYTQIFITPAVLIAIWCPCVFLLPADSQEKVTLGGTLLLSLMLLLVMTIDSLPKAEYGLPIVGVYYLFTMVMVTVSMIISAAVVNISNRGPRRKKVPYFLRQIFLNALKRIVLLGDDTYYPLDELESVTLRGIDRPNPPAIDADGSTMSRTGADNSGFSSKLERDVDEILKQMRTVAVRTTMSEARREIENEWKLVGMVIDRLLFVIFIIIFVISTIAILA